MTNEELNKLADMVVLKLIKRQASYDAEFMKFITELPKDYEIGFMTKALKTDEELDALHLERLESLLHQYLEEERYEDAAVIQQEIDRIKNEG